MSIKNMHYDFKTKFNKVDSQQYKNFIIPQIDWVLNEAASIFVKTVASPRYKTKLGVETSQRNIDDIRNIVVPDCCVTVSSNIGVFPEDYLHYLKGHVLMEKDTCSDVRAKLKIQQHDDNFEESPFEKSSFEWREVNGVFIKDGLKFYTDGTFQVTDFCMSYLKKLDYFHNAEDFPGEEYNLPDGTILVGSVDCELAEDTHREIVDIAVLLVTGQINIPDYEIKLNKLKLNNLN